MFIISAFTRRGIKQADVVTLRRASVAGTFIARRRDVQMVRESDLEDTGLHFRVARQRSLCPKTLMFTRFDTHFTFDYVTSLAVTTVAS